MTISSSGSSISYAGNGLTSTFAFPYEYQDGADLVVTVTVTATGVATTLVYGTDYGVNPPTNSPANIGSVLAVVPVASGSTIDIRRVTPLTQETAWQENDAYPANSDRVENALDKLTLALQEQVDGSTITDAALGTGTATFSTFLRGANSNADDQRVWSDELVGAAGPTVVPSDVQTVLQAGQAAAAAIKVKSGATAAGAFRYAVDGDTNAWTAQWVYDPNLGKLGWQFYGGSILGTFDNAGGANFTGTVNANRFTGNADGSLITTGLVPTARLASGAASSSTFLRGDQTWAVVSGGGGGINTTTTGTFVIAAVNSTQTVPVTSATGIVVGTELIIGDGAHQIIGLVTVVASLNLTVKTQQISLGSSGNTMASGAAVQSGTVPGSNTIQSSHLDKSIFSINNMAFSGGQTQAPAGNPPIFLYYENVSGGTGLVAGYPSDNFQINFISAFTSAKDQLAKKPAANTNWTNLFSPSATGDVVRSTDGNTITFGKLTASDSITAATITPALLNLTNSLVDGEAFTYDSASGHFKMAAVALASGTAAQFINGAGTSTNVLAEQWCLGCCGNGSGFRRGAQAATDPGITITANSQRIAAYCRVIDIARVRWIDSTTPIHG